MRLELSIYRLIKERKQKTDCINNCNLVSERLKSGRRVNELSTGAPRFCVARCGEHRTKRYRHPCLFCPELRCRAPILSTSISMLINSYCTMVVDLPTGISHGTLRITWLRKLHNKLRKWTIIRKNDGKGSTNRWINRCCAQELSVRARSVNQSDSNHG